MSNDPKDLDETPEEAHEEEIAAENDARAAIGDDLDTVSAEERDQLQGEV